MSTSNPQSPETRPSVTEDADSILLDTSRGQRCRIALLAFLLALATAPPVVGPLAWRFAGPNRIIIAGAIASALAFLAVVLGVIGIFRTRKRRRRGRWLAIAAIMLGMFGCLTQLIVGQLTYVLHQGLETADTAIQVLAAPRTEAATSAAQWYERYASESFRESITEAKFAAWLESTISQHGQLQSRQLKQPFARARGTAQAIQYNARFVNGGALVEIVVGLEAGKPVVQDLRVGDSSPLD